MPASTISAPQRFSLTLDPGLVLERLILARLSELTRKRAQDWLRALLVQGFLVEGQWLQSERRGGRNGAAPIESAIPATPFAGWLGRADGPPLRTAVPETESVRPTVTAVESTKASRVKPATQSKPFAHLRKVIG